MSGALPGNETEDEFFKGIHEPDNQDLKQALLAFDQPEESLKALEQYVNAIKEINTISVQDLQKSGQSYSDYVGNITFERMVSYKRQGKIDPQTWITDGNNSLLFIQTIRQLADVLDKNNLSAPEVVIQVNRGTKFVEDQLRALNAAKGHARQRFEQIQNSEMSTAERKKIQQQLQPVELGPRYVQSILSWQVINNSIEALGWQSFNAIASLASERISTLWPWKPKI